MFRSSRDEETVVWSKLQSGDSQNLLFSHDTVVITC